LTNEKKISTGVTYNEKKFNELHVRIDKLNVQLQEQILKSEAQIFAKITHDKLESDKTA
jgi:hypothetical protein